MRTDSCIRRVSTCGGTCVERVKCKYQMLKISSLVQAFGAKRYAAMGIIAQKAALICLALSALIILAWTQLDKALLLLGETHALLT